MVLVYKRITWSTYIFTPTTIMNKNKALDSGFTRVFSLYTN